MKRLALSLLLAAVAVLSATAQELSAREERVAAREERHRISPHDNTLFITAATALSAYDQWMHTAKVEYSRHWRGNLYWGALFSMHRHDSHMTDYDISEGMNPYVNQIEQDIYKLGGRMFYRLPVIRSRLYFRVGAGVSLGWHAIEHFYGDRQHHDRMIPYFDFEAAWIWRVCRNVEFKFSPTVALLPSEVAVSPVKLGGGTTVVPFITDLGFSFTCGVRF